LYNQLPMRPFRPLAGLLILSLVTSVVLGDFFHGQGVVSQESHHLAAHIDSTHADEASGTLGSGAEEGSCHVAAAQVAVVSLMGQRLSATDAARVVPIAFVAGGTCERETYSDLGRTAPLFEHASLFAATISMRV
jgi:hypothetical protein